MLPSTRRASRARALGASRAAAALAVALLSAAPATAQLPGLAPTATPSPAPEGTGDPYRRETPSGAFFGFMRAAARENWGVAAEYLQWPRSGKTPADAMARELKAVLDERFVGDLEKLSHSTTGDLNDGLGPDSERAGSVQRGEDTFDVVLVRVPQPEGPPGWVFSTQTLREVPPAFRELSAPALDRVMPAAFRRNVAGSLRLWQLLAFWLLIPAAWLLARLGVAGIWSLVRRVARRRASDARLANVLDGFRGPLALLAAVPLHAAAVSRLGLPLLGRYNYERVWRLIVVAGATWLVIRLVAFLLARATLRLQSAGATATSSLTIGRRVLQGIVVFAGVLVGLGMLGVNLTATLAGLGIGGLAVAFAAQKSLENLFGGVVVLSDRILRVGDVVKVGAVLGEVEDVTLYATRLRTFERSVVSIPNGTMMTSQIENLSRRDKFLFRHTFGLAFETTAAQMDAALAGCRARLAADRRVEPGSRVRFQKVNAYSLDVEVFAYVLAPDWAAFLAAQEELLLALMRAVEESGSRFAFPTQTTYLASEAKALQPAGALTPPPAAP